MGPLTISVGCAVYPKDAFNFDDLFMLADFCLYRAKNKGRNRYIIYVPEKHGSLEEIRSQKITGGLVPVGRDIHPGELIVGMIDRYYSHRRPSPEDLLREFAYGMKINHVELLSGNPIEVRYKAGSRIIQTSVSEKILSFIIKEEGNPEDAMMKNDFVVINRLEGMPPYLNDMAVYLKEHGILSLLLTRFRDRAGSVSMLVLMSVGAQTQWNQQHFKYYRAFARLLSMYELT